MIRAVADTHAIIWHLFADPRLSTAAKAALEPAEQGQVALSAISLIEIVYLMEKGRVPQGTLDGVLELLDQPQPSLVEIPLDRRIINAMKQIPRTEVPDMPDRIIAATAATLAVPLVSRDGRIRASSVTTIW